MTDREAIKILEEFIETDMKFRYYAATVHALKALQEQEERSKGCEWCDTLRARCALYDAIGETNFCPMCGRPLKGEDNETN